MQLYQSIIFHPSRPCQTKNYPTVSASLSHFLSASLPFTTRPSFFHPSTLHPPEPHTHIHLTSPTNRFHSHSQFSLSTSLPQFTSSLTATFRYMSHSHNSLLVSPHPHLSFPIPLRQLTPHLTSLHLLNLTSTFHFLPHLTSPPSIWSYDSDKSKSDNKRQTEKHYTQKHGSCSFRIRI